MHHLRLVVPSVAALLGPWIVFGCSSSTMNSSTGTGGQGGAHGTSTSVTSSQASTSSASSTTATTSVASTSTTSTGTGGAGVGGASTGGTSTSTGTGGTSTGTGGTSTSTGTGGTGTGTGGTGTGTGGAVTIDARPPPPPAMMAPDGTGTTTFAITELFLGDTDPCSPPAGSPFCTGNPDQANGWESYGYNIDGVSPNNLSAFCKTVNGASPQTVHQEGMLPGQVGVENSWGHNTLQVLLGTDTSTTQTTNQALQSGGPTVLLTLVQLGSGTSYSPLVARLYQGASLGSTPKYDGTDLWPIDPVSLASTSDPTSAKVQFPMSYVTNDTWVSGTKGMVTVSLDTGGYRLDLPISNAVITMIMDPSHQDVAHGTISGVIATQPFQNEIQMIAGGFDMSLCSGSTIQSILALIAQGSDIMSDGTQDPTQTCNGISIGLGFNATVVQLGPVAAPTPPQPNPCGDAGP